MRLTIFSALIGLFAFAACVAPPPKLEYVEYVNEAAVPRITPQDAKKDFDAGHVLFVDSRSQAAFDVEHLPGAVVIPYMGEAHEYDFNSLPKGKKIIVYCS